MIYNSTKIFTLSATIFALSLLTACAKKMHVIEYHQETILLDGLDEESPWSRCEQHATFMNPWVKEADQGTLFKSYNDGQYLYFYFSVKDKHIICHDDSVTDTAVEYSDRVELFFTKDSSMQAYCGLEIDACGRRQSFYGKGYRTFVEDWDFPAFSDEDYKVLKKDKGYQVEGRIPLRSLQKIGLIDDDHLYLGVFRADRQSLSNKKDINWISWKDIDTAKPDFHTFKGFKRIQINRE